MIKIKIVFVFLYLALTTTGNAQNSTNEVLDIKAFPIIEVTPGAISGTTLTKIQVEATVNTAVGIKKIHVYVGSKRDMYNLFRTIYFVTTSMGKPCVVSQDGTKTEIMNNNFLRFDFTLDEKRFSNFKSIKIIIEDQQGKFSLPAYFDQL